MTTQTIKVEVPEGMEIDKTTSHIVDENIYMIRLQKIQPRRIVLDETAEVRKVKRNEYYIDRKGNLAFWSINCESIEKYNIVREVKETDIPLTNEEPKLSLSVAECKRIVNCTAPDVVSRILEFIKDK